jgi:WD40-like Beta Propeller Repeat/Lysyl oxidase
MTRSRRHSLAVVALAVLPPAAGGMAFAALEQDTVDGPFRAIVAAGPTATAAVLPDGTWRAELALLYPGDTDPAVSPDGRQIAFVSTRDGNEEIYVADARTGEVRRLTRDAQPDRRPAWAPHGRSIAWQSGPQDAADLYVMFADGEGKRRVVGGPGDDLDPAWSPDGNRIAFSSTRSGRRQLWAVAALGGEAVQLGQIPGRVRAPAWGPGGLRIAFALESGAGSDIWALTLADGSTRKFTPGPGWDSRPDWSPRGTHIAFARATGGRSSIWVVGADGAPGRPVDGSDGLADPDWTPTDRSLVPRPDEHLPDLDQRAPADVRVVQAGRRFKLGFASSTENRGVGPLFITGARRTGREMRAHQRVETSGGATRVIHDVGRIRYERHAPHFHWHLKSFVTYQLHRASDFAVVARDGKSGFCLIDRWGRTLPELPGTGPPRFVGDCGTRRPRARRVELGTSVGYIDRYPVFFHGQELNVTPLPAGQYVLVHRANSERRIRELAYSNDAASVLLELTWPNGKRSAPRISILERCDGSERCPALPPALSTALSPGR